MTLVSVQGYDTLDGGEGDDTLVTTYRSENSALIGGAAAIWRSSARGPPILRCAAVIDPVSMPPRYSRTACRSRVFERFDIEGTFKNDTIAMGGGDDTIRRQHRDDTLSGGEGKGSSKSQVIGHKNRQ